MKKLIIFILVLSILGCNKVEEKEEKVETEKEIIEEVKLTKEDYINNNVNELGNVPIMMYHGIHNLTNEETNYIGGNVDKSGYQRTQESFRNDLEFYYNNNYRMIRLSDYVDGKISVELGKSPIILTFDDGLKNNINITGLDEEGNIIIDPNCAVGILEEFKKKYKDFNVTATFFLNGGLFQQKEYNEKIIKWLIENGYDIGNHTYSHVNFSKVDNLKTQEEVGKMYEILENIIPGKYVNIVALPFGSPYKLDHENMNYIFTSNYNNKTYNTKATLRVGWESELSPYSISFNPKFLKRIRAYDNNGSEFDIEMNFKILEDTKYVSDGKEDTIVIKEVDIEKVNNIYKKQVIVY